MEKNGKLSLKALCEGAVFVAMAQILGYLKLFSLPQGGSITLNMLPIFVYCIRWGFGPGILASFALSLLQLFLDGAYAWGWQSILGDYILAYTLLGLCGLFKGKKNGLVWGPVAGAGARFLCSWVVGATVWGEYMPEAFFGMRMSNPWLYSALYNGSYIFINTALCIVVCLLLREPLKRYLFSE